MGSEGRPVLDLVHERIPSQYKKKWVYYIGDEEPSDELVLEFQGHGLEIIHRDKHQILQDEDLHQYLKVNGVGSALRKNYRDIFAAIDFSLCSHIDAFIGNSVSTFSDMQIAKRGGINSSWYNSRSIPLAGLFDVYYVPIVYTYTELSQGLRKSLLEASIASARSVFGLDVEIHVIYHGSDDADFLRWLNSHNIIVHNHKPEWSALVDTMTQNDLGSWQKVDIPLFIN